MCCLVSHEEHRCTAAGSSRVTEGLFRLKREATLQHTLPRPLFSYTWFRVGKDGEDLSASTLGVLARGGDCIVMALGTCAEEGSQSPTSMLLVPKGGILHLPSLILHLPSLARSRTRITCVYNALE